MRKKQNDTKPVASKNQNEIINYGILKEKERLRVYLQEKFLPYLHEKFKATKELSEQFQARVTALSQLAVFLQQQNQPTQQQLTPNQSYVKGVVDISAPYLEGVQGRLDAEDLLFQIEETEKMLQMLLSITDPEALYTWGVRVGCQISLPRYEINEENATSISSQGTFLSTSDRAIILATPQTDAQKDHNTNQTSSSSMPWDMSNFSNSSFEMRIFKHVPKRTPQMEDRIKKLMQNVTNIKEIDPDILKFGLFHAVIHDKFWEIVPTQLTVVQNQDRKKVPIGIKKAKKCNTFTELYGYAIKRISQESSSEIIALLVKIIAAKNMILEDVQKSIGEYRNEHMQPDQQFQPQQTQTQTQTDSQDRIFSRISGEGSGGSSVFNISNSKES